MPAAERRRHLHVPTSPRALRQAQRDITPRATTIVPSGSRLRILGWLPAQQVGLQTVDEPRDYEAEDSCPNRKGVCRDGRAAEAGDVNLAADAGDTYDD